MRRQGSGAAVRYAVSKAWNIPCSFLTAQIMSGPGTIDALKALMEIFPHATPALVLIGAGLMLWVERIFGICMDEKAIVSLAWLGTGKELIRRVCSVSVHEAGHLLGLGHRKERCVMHPAYSLKDLDSRPLRPCRGCRHSIK